MKEKLGPMIPSYPMPVALVGTKVNCKPNFMAVAWFSMLTFMPPTIGVVLNSSHYTNKGIKETGCFSLCIPGQDMVEAVDYAGLVSGAKADKSSLFELFEGVTGAPLIKDCPVAIECKLEKVDRNGPHELFAGKIIEVHADKSVLVNGKIDLKKVKPFMLSQGDTKYYGLGEMLGAAWSIGKNYKK